MVVPVQISLSLTWRWLTRVIAVTCLLPGLIMFALPGAIGLVIIMVIATSPNIGAWPAQAVSAPRR